MKWIVLLEERGDGCDYSIDCGIAYYFIEADSKEAALTMVREDLGDRGLLSATSEKQLETAYLLPAAGIVEVPFAQWTEESESTKLAKETKEAEEKEHAEFERLGKKFG